MICIDQAVMLVWNISKHLIAVSQLVVDNFRIRWRGPELVIRDIMMRVAASQISL